MLDNKIKPFGELLSCPKCGAGKPDNQPPMPALTEEMVDAMPFGVAIPIYNGPMPGFSPIRTRYCPGGQEPETVPELDPIGASLQMIQQMTSHLPSHLQPQMPAGPRGKINICAGIGEDHLHAICNNCQYEFLMATKDAEVGVKA
jgi:hypothetical protein